jgi:hypothetical protein
VFYALELKTAANFLRFLARKTPGCKVHKIGRLHKIQPFEASVNIQLSLSHDAKGMADSIF